MTAEDTPHDNAECPECRGTGLISAQNCSSCNVSGQIIIHSHEHRHGTSDNDTDTSHDHPHPHAEPHRPGDDTPHTHRHE